MALSKGGSFNFVSKRFQLLPSCRIEQYAGRRYSHDPNKSEEATKAWVILKETVYNNTGGVQDHQYAVPVRRPSNIMTSQV